jgi:ferredoxin-NADP reductase/ferredoxin
MSFEIRLTTRDQQQLSFACEPGQTLIDAADAAQITLPSQCRQGSCGACHANVVHGDFELGPHSAEALPRDAANGILMCCTTAQSDLDIELPCDHSRILFGRVPLRTATIAALENIAENTVRLELRLDADADGGVAAQFEPGEFAELQIPDTDIWRAYSLANTANWDGTLEFLIRLQPQGKFSTFLQTQAQPGMTLNLRGPQGAFGLNEGSLRPRWFVAGGTGLAPMLSMLRRMAEFQETQAARLFFGVNREAELFALDELDRLRAELPQLQVDVCVWKPVAGWQGFVGTPADALREALAGSGELPDIYLCGPAPLLTAAERIAHDAGVPEAQIFAERFLPAA